MERELVASDLKSETKLNFCRFSLHCKSTLAVIAVQLVLQTRLDQRCTQSKIVKSAYTTVMYADLQMSCFELIT